MLASKNKKTGNDELNNIPTTDQPPIQRKVLIETWGCQMNVADSEHLLAMLKKENFAVTDDEKEADLILLNTCHIREKAKHKVLSRLGRIKELKNDRPQMRVAVAGCVAQAEGKKLLKAAPQIDILFGPGKITEFPQLLRNTFENNERSLSLGFSKKDSEYIESPESKLAKATVSGKTEITRYVNITQGCDNFCTFCVVPFTRGREVSRTPEDIIAECQNLVTSGAKEITLLGQNVNSYGTDLLRNDRIDREKIEKPFSYLLKTVSEIEGLNRLRFTTSNPHDFTMDVVDAYKTHKNLGRHLHLPMQSGNDEVLERMKRKVTRAEFLEKLSWLRAFDPDFAVSTDLIVGFPGETEEQFADTLKLLEESQFSFVFAFSYSPRKNTAAIRFKEQVPEDVKKDRLKRLNKLQDEITLKKNLTEIGKEREVLFLYESQKKPGSYYGRTEHFRLVRVDSYRNIVGKNIVVRITEANKTALIGQLI